MTLFSRNATITLPNDSKTNRETISTLRTLADAIENGNCELRRFHGRRDYLVTQDTGTRSTVVVCYEPSTGKLDVNGESIVRHGIMSPEVARAFAFVAGLVPQHKRDRERNGYRGKVSRAVAILTGEHDWIDPERIERTKRRASAA